MINNDNKSKYITFTNDLRTVQQKTELIAYSKNHNNASRACSELSKNTPWIINLSIFKIEYLHRKSNNKI